MLNHSLLLIQYGGKKFVYLVTLQNLFSLQIIIEMLVLFWFCFVFPIICLKISITLTPCFKINDKTWKNGDLKENTIRLEKLSLTHFNNFLIFFSFQQSLPSLLHLLLRAKTTTIIFLTKNLRFYTVDHCYKD